MAAEAVTTRKTEQGQEAARSPIQRAVWDRGVPVDQFSSPAPATSHAAQQAMEASLAIVRQHKQAATLHAADGKVREELLTELGAAGYWGLLVDPQQGGTGASFASFAHFLTRMAAVDTTIAGLAAVHHCIGATGAIRNFGNEEQKTRLLPGLVRGAPLGVFALTEPGAGSDLTALRTTARRAEEHYLVSGEKLFITNLALGRALALVCLVDDKPAVLIAELPCEVTPQIQLRDYGLWTLKHTWNRGVIFRDFPVPRENLLVPPQGDGLTIAYHGLNLGRTALCANAAGSLRIMLANMLPWAKFRHTHGQPLERRELVRRRIGELAGLIVGCDALAAWCAGLIDRGMRCEMECITAKVFASEALQHAAIELYMKTHGGRSFLHGNLFGDHLHDYLAPSIYEGEGEVLSLAFFRSLVKPHVIAYMEPARSKLPYLKWRLAKRLASTSASFTELLPPFNRHAAFACHQLQRMAIEIDYLLRKFRRELADRQCRMVEISQRGQNLVTILTTSLYAARQEHDLVRRAADVLCQRLTQQLTSQRPTDVYFQQVTELGEAIAAGGFLGLEGIEPREILMHYEVE